MAKPVCIGTKKDGDPCTNLSWGTSQYCIGHDPAVTTEQRSAWGQLAYSIPKTFTPQEILAYVRRKVDQFEEQFGTSIQAMPVITELLRVALQAHRTIYANKDLNAREKNAGGPRKVRIVRDELDPRVADAG